MTNDDTFSDEMRRVAECIYREAGQNITRGVNDAFRRAFDVPAPPTRPAPAPPAAPATMTFDGVTYTPGDKFDTVYIVLGKLPSGEFCACQLAVVKRANVRINLPFIAVRFAGTLTEETYLVNGTPTIATIRQAAAAMVERVADFYEKQGADPVVTGERAVDGRDVTGVARVVQEMFDDAARELRPEAVK